MNNFIFIEIDELEFKKVSSNFNNSYFQTSEWACLKAFTGWDSHYVGVYDEGKCVMVSLLLSKRILYKKIFYAPRGILTNYNNIEILEFFTSQIKKFVSKNNGFLFKMDPLIEFCDRDLDGNKVNNNDKQELVNYLKSLNYVHKGFSVGYAKEVQARWSFYLDVSKSEESINKNMNNRCKRCLKKASKYPLVIKEVDECCIKDLKMIMEHTCQRHKCADRSLDYYKNIRDIFKDNAKLLVVYLDRDKYLDMCKSDKLYDEIKKENKRYIPISTGVFLIDRKCVHYVYGGTIKSYMHFMASYELQYFMIKFAKDNKKSIYDFGGISGNFDKNSQDYGIYEFKRGFGGRVIEYIGEFDLVVDKFYFHLYN